jgi:DNA-binding response OmpR family regulator
MNKILVIEDTYDMQKLMQTNLSARGYKVLLASDGKHGLEMAHSENPDLIMLDIRLPDITGWDVLNNLKTDPQLKNIPVFVMTASEGIDDEKLALSMGAACYYSKPFSLHALLIKIEEYMDWKKYEK